MFSTAERLSKMKRVKRTLTKFFICGQNEESQAQKTEIDPVPSTNYFINETDGPFNASSAAGASSEVANPAKSLRKVKVKTSKNCIKDVAGPAKMSTIVEEMTEEPCCSKDLPPADTRCSSVELTSFTEK